MAHSVELSEDEADLIARSLRQMAGKILITLDVSWQHCIFHGEGTDRTARWMDDPFHQRELARIDTAARLVAKVTGNRRDIVYADIAMDISHADLSIDDARRMTNWAMSATHTPEEQASMAPDD